VLVLDGGQPALIGTHDELLARSALYRDLVGYWDVMPGPPSSEAQPPAHNGIPISPRGVLARLGRALARRGFRAPA